jgi:chromosomal replication initiator protein
MRAPLEPFLVLPEHRLAYEAAMQLALAEVNPGVRSVFLHGPSGVGKTHLARLLEFQLQSRQAAARVKSILASAFAADLAEAASLGTIPLLRAGFRELDLLIVEDVQSLQGRLEAQCQLQFAFDALASAGCRFLWISVKPPGQLARYSRRMVSRFRCGVVASMGPLPYESRLRLLCHWVETGAVQAPLAVLELLARRHQGPARELLAAVLRLEAAARQHRRLLDTTFAAGVLDRELAPASLEIEQICRAVARQYSVTVRELRGRPRARRCTLPRQVAMFLAREVLGARLTCIGRHFGNRDHTTVLHACEKVSQRAGEDQRFESDLAQLRAALGRP